MKKLLVSLLMASLLASPVQARACDEGVYDDVSSNCPDPDYKYYDDIVALTELGIFTGNADGTFAPKTGMNRAEFATLLKRLSGLQPENWLAYNLPCFSDIEQGQWYTENVCFAEEQGWFQGYEDGSFGFSREINRAEAIKTVVEMLRIQVPMNGFVSYEDVEAGTWFAPYVVAAEQAGLLEEDMQTFRPGDKMTREEIAYILARAVEYIADHGIDRSENYNVIHDEEWIHYESAISYLQFMYPGFGDDYEYYHIIQHPEHLDLYYFMADDFDFETGDQHLLLFEYDGVEHFLNPIWEAHYAEGDFVDIGGDLYEMMPPNMSVHGYSNDSLALYYMGIDDSPGRCFDPLLIGESYPYTDGARGFVGLNLNSEFGDNYQIYSPEMGEAHAIPSVVHNQVESEYKKCIEKNY